MKMWMRWKQSSGLAKAIVVLATILLVQIGLCALTPTMLPWVDELLHAPNSHDPFEWMSPMFLQAIFCAVTAVVIFVVWAATPLKPITEKKD